MNLPLELVDKILQYDGRIKYRKCEFVNAIHPRDFRYFIVKDIITKKQNIIKTIDTANAGNLTNSFSNSNYKFESKKFYFEFEFDSLSGVGLCYDYYWGYNNFQIVYFDTREGWTQYTTIIAHDIIFV
jgi:hypothetical protein